MPRGPRLQIAGAINHVVSNGHPGRVLLRDDRDRRKFLLLVAEAQRRFDCTCLCYCLLSTHYHLLIRTPEGNLAKIMHFIGSEYARWWRLRDREEACVFKRRYFSIVVSTEQHLRNCAGYIALNPVAAGMVDHPSRWPWSSHAATLRGESSSVVTPDLILETFGGADNYRRFVDELEPSSLPEDARKLVALRPSLADLFARHGLDDAIRLARNEHGYLLREIAAATGLSESTIHRRAA